MTEETENYKICSILQSVPASKRQERLDYLREYGAEEFIKKYARYS